MGITETTKPELTMNITADYLKSVLHYNPTTGIFTRIKSDRNSKLVGSRAGYVTKGSYERIRVDGVKYYAHRLAFLYMTGLVPRCCDHINRNKSDNRWSNLREATQSQNLGNSKTPITNKSGYRGVSWNKRANRWYATIKMNGKKKYLGSFVCKHEAYKSYVTAAREFFKEFSIV